MVERVSEKVRVAALPGGASQDLADRLPQTLVIVGDHELDAKQAALFQPKQQIAPARPALAVGQFYSEYPGLRRGRLWRRPSLSTATAICTAWLAMISPSRTLS